MLSGPGHFDPEHVRDATGIGASCTEAATTDHSNENRGPKLVSAAERTSGIQHQFLAS